MSTLLDKLPTILVLAVLVGIFVSLQKHSPSDRMRLWIAAWALIFVHFFVQVFEVDGRTGLAESIYDSIDLASLELSGLVFLISMTLAIEHRLRRRILLGMLGLPVAFHAVAASFDWHIRWVLVTCVALVFLSGAALPYIFDRHISLYRISITALILTAGVWSVRAQTSGDSGPAITSILALSFALPGVLFWRRSKRRSPGVLTDVVGFLAWGADFPLGM